MNSASRTATYFSAWLALGVLASQSVCLPAHAALGGDLTSVDTDGQHMKAQLHLTTTNASYVVHEIQTANGMVVREYVSPAGKVFAVSWRGPTLPDLQQLLGSHYEDYQNAANAPHPGHRHLSIDRADLVVHSSGRLRAFHGFAYLPAEFPANLSINDLK